MFEESYQPSTKNRSRLAKAATLFASIFGISFGLCGMNVIALMMGSTGPRGFLALTAYVEGIGMAVGSVGLLAVGILFVVTAIRNRFRNEH